MADDDLSFWEKDKSLHPLKDSLHRRPRSLKAVSFDFFDTLVCRLTPEPENLFIEAGRRLESECVLGMSLSPAEFYSTRIAAQESASRTASAEGRSPEISITEIYKKLAPILTDPGRAMQIEKEVERDLCYVNPYIACLVKYVRSLGYRTAVISDTYLSSGDLIAILSVNGFDPALIDLFIASNEAGCTKRSGGELFRKALSGLGITGSELLHIGDNFASDIESSSKFGIAGLHYYQMSAQQSEIIQSERALDVLSQPRAISLNSVRRLSARRHASNDSFGDGAFTYGPVLARFADWSLETFSRAGVKKVLALMREGELLGELLRRAAEANNVNLAVLPCYVSRKSTALASLCKGVTAEKLYELLTGRRGMTIGDALTIAGICREAEQHLPPATLSVKIESQDLLDSVVRLILEGRTLRALVEQRAVETQSLVFDYLSTLIGDEECIGVLDLGWSGSIQRNISRILHNGGRRVKIAGCYLCTTQKAGCLPLEGDEAHAFVSNLWTRGNLVMEVPILAPIGSTEGYIRDAEGRTVPLLGSYQIDEAELNLRKNLVEGILTFQENWLALKSSKGPRVLNEKALAEIDSKNAHILVRLMEYPAKMEAIRLGSLHHDENYGEGFTRVLCDPEFENVFRTKGIAGLFQEMNCYWPQAVIARDDPRLMSGLSQRWAAPYAFGRLGARALHNGKPSSLTEEEHRLLLQTLRDHPHDQIIFFTSGLDGDGEFMKSLAAQRERLNAVEAKPPRIAETSPSGPPAYGGDAGFPKIIEVAYCGEGDETVPMDGYIRISGHPIDTKILDRVRSSILPDSRCIMILTEGIRESDVARALLCLAPSLGPGSMIAANHGRMDLPSLTCESNIKAALQQWYLQTGSKSGFEFLDPGPVRKS